MDKTAQMTVDLWAVIGRLTVERDLLKDRVAQLEAELDKIGMDMIPPAPVPSPTVE